MGIITKRNGKILMGLGVLLIITGFFGMEILYVMFGESSTYLGLGMVFAFCFFVLGPMFAVIGIPLFIIGAKRAPLKLMGIFQSGPHIRTRAKISFLAQQLAIKEKDVISTVSRLKSNGEPVSIDYSTSEVIYDPTLLSPSTEIKKASMTLYEKLTVVFTIIGIIVSIIIALLR